MLNEGPMRFEEVMVPARLFRLWDADDPILHGSSTGSRAHPRQPLGGILDRLGLAGYS